MTKAQCFRIFRRLSDYTDGELSEDICREIKRHMAGCDNCCAFLNTFKKTIELCKKRRNRPVPSRTRIKALRLIRQKIKRASA